MKFFRLLLLTITCFSELTAQDKVKYRDLVFESSTRKKNIYYGEPGAGRPKAYLMDIYNPEGDSSLNRPVIVLMHGGGFKLGSKSNSRMKIWGRRFARMGYVCVSINYRLSKKKPLSRFNDLVEGCLEATEDAGIAVGYLKRNHLNLGIDTSKIIMAGHSAGAMIALQIVYSSPAEMLHLIKPAIAVAAKPEHNREEIAAVVNFWGAIYDTTWLANARVPIVSVHGSKDRVVPINFDDTPMFGSAAIHREATRLSIPNVLKIYEGKGHELQRHFNPLYAGSVARKRWREAADFASSFLYETLYIKTVAHTR
ncbi:alpha/beta hydrolase [Flavitalea sp.]|nr:alpha/beta hydrolase [Flavitalea sp.]